MSFWKNKKLFLATCLLLTPAWSNPVFENGFEDRLFVCEVLPGTQYFYGDGPPLIELATNFCIEVPQ